MISPPLEYSIPETTNPHTAITDEVDLRLSAHDCLPTQTKRILIQTGVQLAGVAHVVNRHGTDRADGGDDRGERCGRWDRYGHDPGHESHAAQHGDDQSGLTRVPIPAVVVDLALYLLGS